MNGKRTWLIVKLPIHWTTDSLFQSCQSFLFFLNFPNHYPHESINNSIIGTYAKIAWSFRYFMLKYIHRMQNILFIYEYLVPFTQKSNSSYDEFYLPKFATRFDTSYIEYGLTILEVIMKPVNKKWRNVNWNILNILFFLINDRPRVCVKLVVIYQDFMMYIWKLYLVINNILPRLETKDWID